MKMKKLAIIPALLVLSVMFSTEAFSWCWKRDTGYTECGIDTYLYVTECCGGDLELWPGKKITWRLSTYSDAARTADIVAGFDKWNAVDMSALRFERNLTDYNKWYPEEDGVSLVNFDSRFCDHFPEYCGTGTLGFSAVFTDVKVDGYQAVDADMILNSDEFDWGGAGSVEPLFDAVAVVAHEAGHHAGLSHSGYECRNMGSAGCGPEFPEGTMYWNYDGGQPTDKSTLELDDIAAMVYGYPKSSLRVRVFEADGVTPLKNAEVTLLGTAFPFESESIPQGLLTIKGGLVAGDVDSALVRTGDGAESDSYVRDMAHFPLTNDNGWAADALDLTGNDYWITPVTRSFHIKATFGDAAVTVPVTLVDGENTVSISLDTTKELDEVGPVVDVTSHVDDQLVKVTSIALTGTATDKDRGDNGVRRVYIINNLEDPVEADNDVALGGATANWSKTIQLFEGPNRLWVIGFDDSTEENEGFKKIMVYRDTTGPTVTAWYPLPAVADPAANPMVAFQFDEAIDTSTINSTNVYSTPALAGAFGYDADHHVATFTPSTTLNYSASYTITVSTGVKDKAGNPLQRNFTYKLATIISPAPVVTPPVSPNVSNTAGNTPDSQRTKAGCMIESLSK